MQTITISEQEYLQMKQTIQSLQLQLALLQDIDFVQKLQLFLQLLATPLQTEQDIFEQEKPLPFRFGAAKGLLNVRDDFNEPIEEFNEYI